MISNLRKIVSLLTGMFVLLVGGGVLGTLIGVAGSRAGFSSSAVGLVTGAFYVGFVLGSLYASQLVARVGHIRAFASLASASSAAIILHGVLVEVYAWAAFRFVTGFAMVGLYVVVESWLSQQAQRAERGGLFAVYLTVTMVAMALGQAVLLLPLTDDTLFAVVSILVSLGLIPIALTRQPEPQLPEPPAVSLRALYRASPLGVVGTIAAGLIHSTFYGLAPVFAVALGFRDAGVALFVGSVILGGAIGLYPVGRFSDHVDRRILLVGILLLTVAAALGLLVVETASARALILGLAYGAAAFNIYGLSAAHLHDHLEPNQILAATGGLQFVFGLGSVVGPVLTGWLMVRYGAPAFPLWIAGVALLAALFALLRMLLAPTIPASDQGTMILSRIPSVTVAEAAPAVDADEARPLLVEEEGDP